jgi:hypothetical protein
MRVCGQRHAPAALPAGKRPGTHCIGGWVGPAAGLKRCGKSRSPLGLDLRTVQPVASRYTDCVISARGPSRAVCNTRNTGPSGSIADQKLSNVFVNKGWYTISALPRAEFKSRYHYRGKSKILSNFRQ